MQQRREEALAFALVETILKLKSRDYRDRESLYLAEGARFIYRAVEHHAEVVAIAYTPEILRNAKAMGAITELRQSGIRCCRIDPVDYYRCTEAKERMGVIAVLRQRWTDLPESPLPGIWVALESVLQPGNLGSMIRSAHAAGVGGFIVLDQNSDVHSPVAVRASMGAIIELPMVRCAVADLRSWATLSGVSIIGAAPQAKRDYRNIGYAPKCVILMGGERKGVSDKTMNACDYLVRIPMLEGADSINVSVAMGIVLYQAMRDFDAAPK
jgi:RNA methyltransferase, TrmH family